MRMKRGMRGSGTGERQEEEERYDSDGVFEQMISRMKQGWSSKHNPGL
jgi:hypothetical protein